MHSEYPPDVASPVTGAAEASAARLTSTTPSKAISVMAARSQAWLPPSSEQVLNRGDRSVSAFTERDRRDQVI